VGATEVGFASTIPYKLSRSADGGRLLVDGVDVWTEIVTGDAGLALDGNSQLGRDWASEAKPVRHGRLSLSDQPRESGLAASTANRFSERGS
jgi:hypothetical protein